MTNWPQPDMPYWNRPRRPLSKINPYIATWRVPQKPNLAKGGIPLTPGDSFPPALLDALGRANTTFIHGLEGPLREAVVEAILEREATARLRERNEGEPVVKLSQLDILSDCRVAKDNRLKWKIRGQQEDVGGRLDLIQKVFNLPRVDALATLAAMLGTKIENLTCPINLHNYQDCHNHGGLDVDIPPLLGLPHIAGGPDAAKRRYVSYIRDHGGTRIGAITMYNVKDQFFCLPATANNGVMTMGLHPLSPAL